jgi:hypothetical protein
MWRRIISDSNGNKTSVSLDLAENNSGAICTFSATLVNPWEAIEGCKSGGQILH